MTDTASAQLTTLAQALQAFERGDHTAAALSTLAASKPPCSPPCPRATAKCC